MTRRLLYAFCGLAVGLVARSLFPGAPAGGYVVPAVLGCLGGAFAEALGERAGLYRNGQAASFVMAVLGAMALMLVYGVVNH